MNRWLMIGSLAGLLVVSTSFCIDSDILDQRNIAAGQCNVANRQENRDLHVASALGIWNQVLAFDA